MKLIATKDETMITEEVVLRKKLMLRKKKRKLRKKSLLWKSSFGRNLIFRVETIAMDESVATKEVIAMEGTVFTIEAVAMEAEAVAIKNLVARILPFRNADPCRRISLSSSKLDGR